MADENGTPAPTPGVITITLTLTPSLQGYHLHVATDPVNAYPESVVEACRRAASFYEQQATAHATAGATVQLLDQIRRVKEQSGILRR